MDGVEIPAGDSLYAVRQGRGYTCSVEPAESRSISDDSMQSDWFGVAARSAASSFYEPGEGESSGRSGVSAGDSFMRSPPGSRFS